MTCYRHIDNVGTDVVADNHDVIGTIRTLDRMVDINDRVTPLACCWMFILNGYGHQFILVAGS